MSADPPLGTSEGLLFEELQAANRDLKQVRGIVSDAVKQLAGGFESIARQSSAQQRLLNGTLAQVDEASPSKTTVIGFISQSEALVARVSDGLNQASQRTLGLTQSLTQVDAAFGSLANLANAVRDVSEQIRVLAFNANLEAGRAGDAGKGFSVVALAVRELSNNFRELTVQIRETVETARETLADTVHVAAAAAQADCELARTTRDEMRQLQSKTALLNDQLATSLHEASRMSEGVHQGVGQCLRGLQFDDLVAQLCQAASARIAACTPLTRIAETAEVDGNSPGRDALLLQLGAAQHRAVQQTSMDAGDVEFF